MIKPPFRSDPSVNINMREVLRKKLEKEIYIYMIVQNPLSGLYYDKPYSFGFKIDEVLNSLVENPVKMSIFRISCYCFRSHGVGIKRSKRL